MTDKIRKRNRRVVRKLVSIVVICIAIVIFANVGLKTYRTMMLQKEVAVVNEELAKLEEENEVLLSTRQKLEDPDYVTTYARGEYMFSKDNERVFYLPSKSE